MRRSRKFLLLIFGVVATLALMIGAGRLFLATRGGQTFVTERVLNLINIPGQTITVTSTDGAWPTHIILNGVAIADRQGIWLTIDRLSLDWQPTRLLQGDVVIDVADAGTLAMARAPLGQGGAGAGRPFDLGGLVRDLRSIHVGRLTVATATFAEPVVGQAAAMSLTGSLRNDGVAKTLTLDAARRDQPGTARFAGRADLGAITLRLDASAQGFTALADVSVGRNDDALSGTVRLERAADDAAHGSVAATLAGTWGNPSFNAQVDLKNLVVAKRPVAQVAGMVRAQRTPAGAYTFSGEGTLADLQKTVPEVARLVTPEGRWNATVTRVNASAFTVEQLQITAGETTLALTGAMTNDELRPATATMRVRGLGRLAGVANDASLTTLEVAAARLTTAGIGEGTLRVTAANLPNGYPNLNGSARWNADAAALRIIDIAGLDQDIKLAGSSTWPRTGNALDHGNTQLTLTATAPRLGFAGGEPLTVSADFKGPVAALAAQIQARSAALGVGEGALTDLVATLAMSRASAGYTLTLDSMATWRGAPATLSAEAKMADDNEIALTLNGAGIAGRMDGDLRIDTRSGLAGGTLSAQLNDMRPLATAFGADAAGSLAATVTLSANGAAQNADVVLSAKNVVTNPLRTPEMTLRVRLEDLRRARRFDATLAATAGQLADRPLATLNGSAVGTAADFDVEITALGTNTKSPLLALSADVTAGDATAIRFSKLEADDGVFKAALTAPATVTITPQSIAVDAIAATFGGGRLTASGTAARDGSSVTAQLEAQGVSVNALVPAGIALPAGTLDGKIDISGPLANTAATARITAAFAADALTATPAFTLAVDARIADGRMTTTANVQGLSTTPASLTAQLPLALDLSAPRLSVDMAAPMTAAATWNGNIAPLWRLLALDDHLLSGDAALDVTISGTPGAPQINGGVKLTDGRYENIPAGLVLRNVALAMTTARGDDLALSLTATDTERGGLTVGGTLLRDEKGAWTADLTGDLDRLAVLRRDQVTASASGKVTYKGPLLAGVINGNLAMSRVAIHLDSTGVPEVPLLRSFAALKADTFEALAPEAPPAPMTLALSLSMAEPLITDGRGLDSAWRGELYIKGSISQPDVVGSLAMERGSFAFLGQTFELESGTVTFTGGERIDPYLNVVAVRQVTDVTAMVNIIGSATAPTITLSSRPSLPQDEVLARLLFNRSMGELGPLESIQLASAAADMTGLARGGISGMVRRSLHLDTFGFGGQSGNALVAGRQIGRNIFVTVEQNVDDTSRVFTITWRLTRHFSLRSSARDQTGADFGVFWRKDY